MQEHSIEVQVPFLQYLYGDDVPFIAICLKDQSLSTSARIGTVLPKVLAGYDYCLIASTDLSHFESQGASFEKDRHVIEAIQTLNATTLHDKIMSFNISMCGPGPTASVLTAGVQSGVKTAEILKYSTSGDVTGDKNYVVAYLSAILRK